MRFKEKVEFILRYFAQRYPDAQTELHYHDAFSLLVAVMLSAQATDASVNTITPALLKRYPTPKALAHAEVEEVNQLITRINYHNTKAKNLVGMAKLLLERHAGQVPSTREELEALPGVGRKTANVILSVIYSKPALAVDTHVFRVANRTGLVKAKTPRQAEDQLMAIIPTVDVGKAHHWLILHGRYTCLARGPKCEACGLPPVCNYYQQVVAPAHHP